MSRCSTPSWPRPTTTAAPTLTLSRHGGANSQDVFSATGNLSALTQGGNLVLSGVTIGTVTTNSAGTLLLTFNGNATQARVNETLQSIAYANSSDAPPASAQIDWTFSDGNSGAQGPGGALVRHRQHDGHHHGGQRRPLRCLGWRSVPPVRIPPAT